MNVGDEITVFEQERKADPCGLFGSATDLLCDLVKSINSWMPQFPHQHKYCRFLGPPCLVSWVIEWQRADAEREGEASSTSREPHPLSWSNVD